MTSFSTILTKLTSLVVFAIALCSSPQYTYAQSGEALTSQQIFDEVVNHYDPDSMWSEFSGKMKMTSLRKGNLTSQIITIDNKTGLYTCIRDREDGLYTKGVEHGEAFFEIDGEKMTIDEVPEKYQKYPYSLSEHYARTYLEHHTFHFSLPLAFHAAEASPLEGVGEKCVFGKQCLSITFAEYPDCYEKGYYHYAITLYVIPGEEYRLHAVHIDNGKGAAKEGMLILLDGEIEIAGIKIPASKITFFDGGDTFFMTDAFEDISDNEDKK